MARRLLYNGYKDKADRICIYTGKPYAERHEVFPGSNRQISIREGFQIDVCHDKHAELQANITPWAKAENLRWKRHFERQWLDTKMETGLTEEQAVREWMSMIGRNYLEEITPE